MIHRNNLNPILVIGLLILAGVGLGWANYRFVKPIPGQDDFTTGYVGANMFLMKGISPYDARVGQAIQNLSAANTPMVGGKPVVPHFSYPLFALIIFGPFSLFNIEIARALWMLAIEICYLVTVLGCLSLSGLKLNNLAFGLVMLWSLVWYIGAHAVYIGQFSVVIFFILVGSVWLFFHGNEEGAGFFLALALVKPELSLIPVGFILVWAIATRHKRLTISLLVGIVFLFAITLLLMPTWPLQWIKSIIDSAGRPDWFASALSRLSFALPGIKKPLFIVLHGFLGLFLIIEWVTAFRKDERYFYWIWLVTLVVTALITPRSETSFTITVIPVTFQLAQVWQQRWGKSGVSFIGLLFLVVLAGSWIFILPSIRQGLPEPLGLYILPPLIGLVVLIWIRYWVIRPPRLPFEVFRDL